MLGPACNFVLGASDPEMREIAEVLESHKLASACAAKTGVPVTARTAYDADGVVRLSRRGRGMPTVLAIDLPLVFVECSVLHRHGAGARIPAIPTTQATTCRPSATSKAPCSVGYCACSNGSRRRRRVCWPPRITV